MALIPSESYSFPEDFVRTVAHARKSMRQPLQPLPPPPEPEPQPLPENVEPVIIEAPVIEQIQPTIAEEPVVMSMPPAVEPEAPVVPDEPKQPVKPMERPAESKPERFFIPSLVPSTLKRKVRWNMRAAAEATPASNGDLPDVRPIPGRPEFTIVRSEPLPPPLKPKPDIRPKISLPPIVPVQKQEAPIAVPEPVNEEPPAPLPAMPEPLMEETTAPPPVIPGARIVEAPSADLVQTLLARALFGSAEPVPTVEGVAPPTEPVPVSPQTFSPVTFQSGLLFDKVAENPVRQFSEARTAPERKRLSAKVRRFLFWEALAVGTLVPLAIVGLLRVFQNPVAVLLIDIATIAAAVAATVMPIFFFAAAPSLPRGEE